MLKLGVIQELADRIERAYLRRRPGWQHGRANPRVWSTAAATLVALNEFDSSMPIDPELFVAAQPLASVEDPWCELVGTDSARHYRLRVRKIVRRLRAEIRREITRADLKIASGATVADVVQSPGPRLSPLARFVVASRAGRPDLAEVWRPQALDQHRSCPLYSQACRGLLTEGDYPDGPSTETNPLAAGGPLQFSAN